MIQLSEIKHHVRNMIVIMRGITKACPECSSEVKKELKRLEGWIKSLEADTGNHKAGRK